jgi:hypothetical protein
MKYRALVTVWIALGLAPMRGFAAGDALTAEARARFDEGVKKYDRGEYEAAHAAFLQAFALKRHPDVLLNLAWSSLHAGHAGDARAEFERYLREATDAPLAKRAEADRGLAMARARPAPAPAPPPAATTTTTAAELPQPDAPDRPTEKPARDARARPVRVGVLGGFSSSDLNMGVGLRGGKAIGHLWIGGEVVYNVGRSVSNPIGATRTSTSAFYVGPEAGVEIDLAPALVLRPYAGAGVAVFATSVTVGGEDATSATDTRAVAWPGLTLLYDVPETLLTFGADSRLVFVPGGPAVGVFATGEMRF